MNNLIAQIFAVSLFLAQGSESLKVIDNIFTPVLPKAPLDEFLTNAWIIRPSVGPWSTIDMLKAVSQQIFIEAVSPDELVIRLKTVYIVEWKEATLEQYQSRRGLYTVDWFWLRVGSTCSRNTLPIMIADHNFTYPYFHQNLRYITVWNIIIYIHTKHHVISFVTEITQKLVTNL